MHEVHASRMCTHAKSEGPVSKAFSDRSASANRGADKRTKSAAFWQHVSDLDPFEGSQPRHAEAQISPWKLQRWAERPFFFFLILLST